MTMAITPFSEWSAEVLATTESSLEALLPGTGAAGVLLAPLHEAMRYAVLAGGKRVRPLLVHAAGEITGASRQALDQAGCAVELIHAYSLVHDDMPCMDNDVLRRGKPTVHVAYGEALAMLVGDALQALAFRAVAATLEGGVAPVNVVTMTRELADAAGSIGMAGGQAIDLAAVGPSLSRESLALLDDYCAAAGLAFQVVDDVLDVEADTSTLGKTAGKDAQANKPTYVSLLGLAGARDLAESLRLRAHRALAPFGPQAARLGELADLIVLRRS